MVEDGRVRVTASGYEKLELLGTGGFSRVFRAYQPRFRRWVAIKVLNFDIVDDRALRGFERECFAMGQVSSHPNIVTVLDSGLTGDERPFIAMEYFEAGTYSDKLAQGPITIEELLRVGVKISGALQTAHDAGILHRDLKPHNIFVSKFNEPALGDFGISTIDEEKTSTGFAGYTVHYAAPEVLDGRPATVQSDLYSLGATFYRLIEGVRPFDGEGQSMVATAVRIVTEDAAKVTREGCPLALRDLVASLMAKDPAARPTSAGEVAAAFQEIQRVAGFGVTDVVLASGVDVFESRDAVTSDEAPTTLRSVTSGTGSSSNADGAPGEAAPDRFTEHEDTHRDSPAAEALAAGAVLGAAMVEDLDATIARSSLGERGDPPVSERVGADTGDAVDPDATIVRGAMGVYAGGSANSDESERDGEAEFNDVDGEAAHCVDNDGAQVEPVREMTSVAGASGEPAVALPIDDPVRAGDGDRSGDMGDPDGATVARPAAGVSWAEHPSQEDTGSDAPMEDQVTGSVPLPEDDSELHSPVEETGPAPERSGVRVEIVEQPEGRRSRRVLHAAVPIIVIVGLLGVAALVVALQGGDSSEGPSRAAQTTQMSTTTFKPAGLPPAPTGLTVRFIDSTTILGSWSPSGGDSSDTYRLSWLDFSSATTTESYSASIYDVSSVQPCLILVRIRAGRSSSPTRSCIRLDSRTTKTFEELSPGDCYRSKDTRDIWEAEVQVVDCEGIHDLEILWALDLSIEFGTYSGEDELVRSIVDACRAAFRPYVGASVDDSRYSFLSSFPTEEDWDAGVRTGYCDLYVGSDFENPDDTRGSARGTGL